MSGWMLVELQIADIPSTRQLTTRRIDLLAVVTDSCRAGTR